MSKKPSSRDSDSMARYLANIHIRPLLTPEQARVLELRSAAGDLGAQHALVTAHLRFVVKIAREYRRYGLPLDDLIQEGNAGLVRAVQKFDPERGVKLISYAVWWIRAKIQAYVLANWSLVRIGTTEAQRSLFFSLARTREKLARIHAREPTVEELAGALRVDVTDVEEMQARLRGEVSLDAPLSDKSEATVGELLQSDVPAVDEVFAARQVHERLVEGLQGAVRRLDSRERTIVTLRRLEEDPLTLREAGAELGISRERVRQLEGLALASLRRALSPLADELELAPTQHAA